ncbi:MAG TPA: hypothetical protein VMX14_01805 [Anaerolineae bacterium]|nr:hypothetical protein [Anaerolineae bacterium]
MSIVARASTTGTGISASVAGGEDAANWGLLVAASIPAVGAADAGVCRGVGAGFKAVGELVGTFVAVGGIEVLVGLGVGDGGDAYASLGGEVAVGGTGVAVGGTGVAVGGTRVAVGGTGVAVGGWGVAEAGTDVFIAALVGVRVGTVCRKPRSFGEAHAPGTREKSANTPSTKDVNANRHDILDREDSTCQTSWPEAIERRRLSFCLHLRRTHRRAVA